MTNAYLPNDLATFFVIDSENADAPCLFGLKRPREARNFTWEYRWTMMRIQMQMLWHFPRKKKGRVDRRSWNEQLTHFQPSKFVATTHCP